MLKQPTMRDSTHLLFTPKPLIVLGDIHEILNLPHLCQELMASEKTPTLSMALPVYEQLVVNWRILANKRPELKHYINIGIEKIMEYMAKGRRTRVYALAMSMFTSFIDLTNKH